jgi:hypothetical protein
MSARRISLPGVTVCRAVVIASAVALAPFAQGASAALTLHYTVPGTTMPWISSGGLNRRHVFGLDDGSSPIDVPLHVLHAHTGDTIVVQYVSGTVSALPGAFPYTDAAGDTAYRADHTVNDAGRFPSYYMTPYPIYLCELVGTFANRRGEIIGQPFAIGDGPASFVVPAGATAFLLGVNDNRFSDNAGNWVVSLSKAR